MSSSDNRWMRFIDNVAIPAIAALTLVCYLIAADKLGAVAYEHDLGTDLQTTTGETR